MITSNNQKLQEQVALVAGTSGDAINVERMIPQATFSQAGTEEVSVQDLFEKQKAYFATPPTAVESSAGDSSQHSINAYHA